MIVGHGFPSIANGGKPAGADVEGICDVDAHPQTAGANSREGGKAESVPIDESHIVCGNSATCPNACLT